MKYSEILVPDWCEYPEATNGVMGCWSLISGCIKEPCETCDCYKPGDYSDCHIQAIVENQKQVLDFLETLPKEIV